MPISSEISIIRPGIMVHLTSRVEGGVHYKRVDLNPEGVVDAFIQADDKAAVESWQTTKVTDDPEEFERATKIRNKARALIQAVCSSTSFGLLCPDSLETELNEAIEKARSLVREHNATARCTRVFIFPFMGRFASNDELACQAIADEVKNLIEGMGKGIDKLDPDAIRDSVTKAKAISAMLAPEQSEKVSLAIEAARKAARAITKRVVKDGEEASKVLEDLKVQRSAIETARFAFLDLSDSDGDSLTNQSAENALPGVELGRFDLDLDNQEGTG